MSGVPVPGGLASLVNSEQQRPIQHRLDKLLGMGTFTASVLPSLHDEDELEEGDVWAAEDRSWGSFPDSEGRKSQNSPPYRISVGERNGAMAWGLHEGVKFQGSFDKDSNPARPAATARGVNSAARGLNGLSTYSPQDDRPRSPTGRRSSREGIPRRIPTASRMIPRSLTPEESARRTINRSAPVNIPDWSKILKSERPNKAWVDDSDDEREDEEERLPPHQLLAREYARSQMTPFSVFEGAGRTLKGRDLSRVRNAILTQTGFFD
eukprot:c23751_g1_i2 orf=263-1060(-)